MNQANNVLAQKYSNPNANPNQSFYSYGKATQTGYDPSMDKSLSAQYNKAMTDYMNYSNAEQQAQNYNQQRTDQQRQASLALQQGQKYIPTQLQAMGLGNTGLSETSQVGLMNTYANVLNQANRDYATNMNQMYQDLASTNRESAQNLDAQLEAYEQQKEDKAQQSIKEQYNILANAISNIEDSDLLAKYMETYKNVADPNLQMQYDYKQKYLQEQNKQLKDQQTADYILKNYGVDISESERVIKASDIDPEQFDFNRNKEGTRQRDALLYVQMYADEIPNGSVIDINWGLGKEKYLVHNGMLYSTDKAVTITANQLAKRYRKKTKATSDIIALG